MCSNKRELRNVQSDLVYPRLPIGSQVNPISRAVYIQNGQGELLEKAEGQFIGLVQMDSIHNNLGGMPRGQEEYERSPAGPIQFK